MNPERVFIHATAVVIAEAGIPFGGFVDKAVLLLGPPGAGKSDLALRLIATGARLLADDQTALSMADGWVMAESPPILTGRIEIRGVGIVRVPHAAVSRVILAVELTRALPPRLPYPRDFAFPAELQAPAASAVPLIALDPFEASAPAKVAAAAAAIVKGGVVAGAFRAGPFF
jgi:HPr kinase/phosphorylase